MLARKIALMGLGALAPLVIAVIAYAGWVLAGTVFGIAHASGVQHGLAVHAPVTIVRDERGIPHVRATSLHDAYFAEGYALASDRLFQIDVTRRYVRGRLAEVLGAAMLEVDMHSRIVDVGGTADAAYARLAPAQRDLLQAFADGINAAAQREPTPPEYRALLTGFEPWRPQDALAVGFATVLELVDNWDDVIARDAVLRAAGAHGADAWYPLSDPLYDAPAGGGRAPALAPLPPLAGPGKATVAAAPLESVAGAAGSNAWAAGAARTATGRALLANDPHLRRTIPGIWYLVDVAAPGYHVAGATLAGVPGIVLGHNEHLAWGATNGDVVALRVTAERFTADAGTAYRAGPATAEATPRREVFHVRFGGDATRSYLRTRHGFVVEATGTVRHAVAWDAVDRPRSPLAAFEGLAGATSVDAGLQALASYPGPTQNFVLADVTGRAAYTLAGAIPLDADWGLRVGDGAAVPAAPRFVPFADLPHVGPARDALVVTANNLPYAAGYPLRLSPRFTAPYRAAEIRRKLAAGPRLDVEGSRAAQADTTSLGEAELARAAVAAAQRKRASADPDLIPALAALTAFDGRMDPASRGATVAQRLRLTATGELVRLHLSETVANAYFASGAAFPTLLRALRERPRGWFAHDDPDAFLVDALHATVKAYGTDAVAQPYGEAYAVATKHPLASFGFWFWNGPVFAGAGGAYAPAVQANVAQSFRAVWDVGNWDAGGIDIPLGESGEPGSAHYHDLAERWRVHALTPLPFSAAAVAAATRAVLTLTP